MPEVPELETGLNRAGTLLTVSLCYRFPDPSVPSLLLAHPLLNASPSTFIWSDCPFVLVRSSAIFQQFLLFNWHLFVYMSMCVCLCVRVCIWLCECVCNCKYSCVFIGGHFTTGGRHFCNYSTKLIWFLILISIDSIFNEWGGTAWLATPTQHRSTYT